MVHPSPFRMWMLVIAAVGLVASLATADTTTSPPTITLEKAVHFTTPNGDPVVVGPGTYEVEAVKDGLKLTPKGGKGSEAVIVQASSMPHGEALAAPKAASEPGIGPDEYRIALLLPDNQGFEASGSFSGIRSRGLIGTNAYYGIDKLPATNTGIYNSAFGVVTLDVNTTGSRNTATGYGALSANTMGSSNTATGNVALASNTTGGGNTATGADALRANTTGGGNTATGYGALSANTMGNSNTATGNAALVSNTTGTNNTAIGYRAGFNQTTGSYNIYLNHIGVAAESGTIRIGTAPNQTRAFIAGISGVAVSGTPVVVDANGQLGVAPSSLRYKEDIRDLGTASEGLHQLRPVSFRYKSDKVAGAEARARDYGLIAEEVAEVYPELVGRDANGRIVTVHYHKLIPMLLNELQKQQQLNDEQGRQIREQRRNNEALEARLAKLEPKYAHRPTR